MNGLQLVHHAGSCIGHCRATRLEMDHFCAEQQYTPVQETRRTVVQEEKWQGCCNAPSKPAPTGKFPQKRVAKQADRRFVVEQANLKCEEEVRRWAAKCWC